MFNIFNSSNDDLFEASFDCSEILDQNSNIVKMNRHGLELMEIDNFSLVKNTSWLGFWSSEDRVNAHNAFCDALEGKSARFLGKCLTFKNNEKWWDVVLSPIVSRDKTVSKIYCVSRDVTESKKLEISLLNERKKADKRNKLKSQFVANVSHELRSPLTSVLGYADLLTQSTLSSSIRVDYAQRIKNNGEHLLSILNDILDISKVESGKFNINQEDFNFKEFVQKVHSFISGMAQKRGVQVKLEIDDNIPDSLKTDDLRLRQVLLNLLSNAIKFSNGKDVDLKITKGLDNLLIFDVIDHGIGMGEKYKKDLFNAYKQESNMTSKVFGGSGLGLHLSKKLCKELGGDLKLVYSEEDVGTCFRVEMPFVTCDSSKTIELKAEDIYQKLSGYVKNKILVVDDAKENQHLIGVYLNEFGINYDVACDGREAVEKCFNCDYDLVLMDILMPKLNGIDATKLIRHRKPNLPVLAFTAHAARSEINRILESGFNAHLAKPFNKKDLYSTIRNTLINLQ